MPANTNDEVYVLNLLSFNVRGIRQEIKRHSIYQYIKKKNIDICFLQETHSTDKDENQWKNEWGGEVYYSHGTSQARGVMVLVRPGFDLKVDNIIKGDFGRFIYMKILTQGAQINVLNIYAPNLEAEQLRFYRDLDTLMEGVQEVNDKWIIGGDFNVIFDPDMDRKGGNFRGTNAYISVIEVLDEIIEKNNLCDIWRVRHPELRSFTWRQRRPEIHSRLDVFLISDHLQDFVREVDIKPSLRSDHSSIVLKIYTFKTSRGHGYWKLNSSFVDEYDYIKSISDGIEGWKLELRDIVDDRVKWEFIKYKIRNESINYGKTRKSTLNKRQIKLETELDKRYHILDSGTETEEDLNRRLEVEAELRDIDNYKTEGLILRSKCRWYEKGERSNNYFLGLINHNRTKVTMNKLRTDNGDIEINPENILNMQGDFYKRLYTERNEKSNADMLHYLNNIHVVKLTDGEKDQCEGIITEEECREIIKTFRKGKTPGIDGLTIEFYLKFWHLINETLIKAYNASYQNGELSETQKRGIITLLDKGKDRTELKNWRPITLLNVDYKILSKVLAERVKKFLPKLINHNQVGYVKGRNIGDNIRTVSDLMFMTRNENIGGILIGIDFKKAFDSVNWNFLTNTLKHYNFGSSFIKWVSLLYKNSNSCIINNGRMSDIFKLGRGVRQGDPLSPYLFILVAEILSQIIRQDNQITGFNIVGNQCKILQYADDTIGCLSDILSAKQFMKQVEEFGFFSGLKLNKDKTEGMWLGRDRFNQSKPLEISWPIKPLKILGIYLSYDNEACEQLNFHDRIRKCKQILNSWKGRNLTLFGRTQIIKTFIVSQFLYIASSVHFPNKYILEINRMIFDFIWKGKSPKLRKDVLVKKIEFGGINVPDFSLMVKSALINWVKKYDNDLIHSWKYMLKHFATLSNINLEMFLRGNCKVKTIIAQKNWPNFYLDMFEAWRIIGNVEGNRDSVIWYNDNIKISGKTIMYQDFSNVGIDQISDLYDEYGQTIPFQSVIQRGVAPHRWLTWHSLLTCVNKQKDLINQFRIIDIETSRLCVGKAILSESSSKDNYALLYNIKYDANIYVPRICKYFDDAIANLDWSIYYVCLKSIMDMKTREFQYKFLHDIHVNNFWLFKWKIKDSEVCPVCNEHVDTIVHMFWECKRIEYFMSKFRDFLLTNFNYILTKQDFFLGTPHDSMLYLVIVICKKLIYQCRLNEEVITMSRFILTLKMYKKFEFSISKDNNSVDHFVEKWGALMEI